MSKTIQIDTVSNDSAVSDYWPESFFDAVDFECDVIENKTRTAYLTESTIEAVFDNADAVAFHVEFNPDLMFHHPDAEVRVSVHDGYIE